MARIVVCTFREQPKSYHLDAGELSLPVGTPVVAHTARGLELGRVKWPARDDESGKTFPPVARLATPDDLARHEANKAIERDAVKLLRERAAFFELPLKPVGADCLLDRARLFLFYESEARVDFRELVRDLSSKLGVRVHLQAVNAREAARVIGGVGVCGQPLCCTTWLDELPPITLRMAKEQGVNGTVNKLSGACGRLKCCLRFEIPFYRDQNARLPQPGDPVDTAQGPATVIETNALSEKCTVRLADGHLQTLDAEELRAQRTLRGAPRACSSHVSQGGKCGGASGGGCSSGGCSSGGCGSCGSKKARAT